jgi:dissimilatory sulfite reductase (desulfoviridin) alpha/beta subunit
MSTVKSKKIPGCITQKDKNYRVIRIKVLAANISSKEMDILSDVAERYGRSYVSLTSRMGIEIPWVPAELLEAAVAELKEAGFSVGSTGTSVRAIVSCKGTVCRYGLEDTQEMCRRLDEKYYGMQTPAKFKIGITGCPNNCIKTQLNDLGFMGQSVPEYNQELCIQCNACIEACKVDAISETDDGIEIDTSKCINCGSCIRVCPTEAIITKEKGLSVYLGGKFGRKHRIGERMSKIYNMDEAIELTGKLIDFYKENAIGKERFGDMLDRLNIEIDTLI